MMRRRGVHPVNVCAHRETKGAECHCGSDVGGSKRRRTSEPEPLVTNVRDEHSRANRPSRKPPLVHMRGRQRESDADERVDRASNRCSEHPRSRRLRHGRLIAEILEVRRDTKIFAANQLNHRLQFVLLFSCDANLPVL